MGRHVSFQFVSDPTRSKIGDVLGTDVVIILVDVNNSDNDEQDVEKKGTISAWEWMVHCGGSCCCCCCCWSLLFPLLIMFELVTVFAEVSTKSDCNAHDRVLLLLII